MTNLLEVRASQIQGAGKGLFVVADLRAGTRLGEYTGRRTKSAPHDGSYTWDVNIYHPNGTFSHLEYVDALRTPTCKLRYANGARTPEQRRLINAEMYQYGGRVYYKTTKHVRRGTEIILDYGDNYW
jgi:hypothetical protein